jgi:myo-inositol 2-dehydrogenase / D-chiro-inositol 1-dehydrogenase
LGEEPRPPCRVLVIGAGFMGSLHARQVAELPNAKLVAVADSDRSRGVSLAQKCGTNWFPDYRQALDKTRPDAVIIATPEDHHLDPCLDAFASGAHVLVEKPLASTVAEAQQMAAASEQSGRSLMVGFILRFEVAYAKIKEAVASENLGTLVQIYCRRNATISEARRLAGRTSVLKYLGVHDLDLMMWLHPVRVTQVRAWAFDGPVKAEFGQSDAVWLEARFADGAVGVLETAWCLSTGWASWKSPAAWSSFGDIRLDAIGTRGLATLDFTPMNVVATDDEGWKFPDTRHWPLLLGRLAGALKLEDEYFVRSCLTGSSVEPDAVQGLRALLLAEAGEASIREGKPVTLPDHL